MNPHHLELFYFVAKYEGITEAVRKMPYGIQQPAVSGQILQLEKNLGVKLFRRRPFALTPAGEELYEFIEPFFSKLDLMAERLSGEESQHLRLAASSSALTYHLPNVLTSLRERYPNLRLTLKELTSIESEIALEKQEADIALSIIHRKASSGIKVVKLIDIKLTLLAPTNHPFETFKDLTKGAIGGHIQEPLIALPKQETASICLQKGLTAQNLVWETSMEVSDIGLIDNYVSKGFGFGLAADIPGRTWPESVKKIKLPQSYPDMTLGIMYTGTLKPVAEQFVELAKTYADKL